MRASQVSSLSFSPSCCRGTCPIANMSGGLHRAEHRVCLCLFCVVSGCSCVELCFCFILFLLAFAGLQVYRSFAIMHAIGVRLHPMQDDVFSLRIGPVSLRSAKWQSWCCMWLLCVCDHIWCVCQGMSAACCMWFRLHAWSRASWIWSLCIFN